MMNRRATWSGILAALLLVALALAGCGGDAGDRAEPQAEGPDASPEPEQPATEAGEQAAPDEIDARAETAASLPRLVDLGRGTCIPCKMMAPILEGLQREYEGRAVVEVIDLREDAGAATDYGIRVIPTQIFFDSEGNEVWRHEGFLPREDIVAKFAEMGVPPLDD
jgi:thioredoxin 1